MQDAYTEDLGKFGFREIKMLRDLLNAWVERGLPDDFSNENVRPAMNMNSGFVFLVNEDYQTAMMNGDKLESFYSSPYEGKEGFFDELKDEYNDMHHEDQEWLRDIAKGISRESELPEQQEAE